ncbi:MAG: TetR/AcrR family transcriptional regulator [Halanaerobiales bacterium]|nr:TetR/AcrR family transcriptional regulator [Halanaerobiales bacterium]
MAEETRNKILESAFHLFSKNNYHAVSMTQIAEGAEISKGTLYWYFDSKEQLFRKTAINGLDYFHELFEEIAEKDISSDQKIRNLIDCVLKTLIEHLDMLEVFRNNVELISSDFKDAIEAKHKKNQKIVTRIVEQGIAEGLIRSENPANLASLILSVLFTPQVKELLDKEEKAEDKVDFIYDFIMNGISRKEPQDEK